MQLGEVLMVSKKKRFSDDEIPVFNDGCIYKRGDYWHFRLWLRDENKYARKSLGTTNRAKAIERGEAFYLELRANQQIGKKYFSLTAKEGVLKKSFLQPAFTATLFFQERKNSALKVNCFLVVI
ncbi:hypothetical protein [Erythrobacter sanguineus]|nr:hypothetical protein [Erythrobacter sanguineus]